MSESAATSSERRAQTIRGALWHGQGLGGHNNYRAAEVALAGLLAEIEQLREQINSERVGHEYAEGLPEGTFPRV